MADNKRKLILSASKDWDAWLSVVRAKATGYQVWNNIDPSIATKPAGKMEPTEPDLDATQTGEVFAEKHARYKILMGKYKKSLQDYEKEKEHLGKLVEHIFDTTSVANLTYIEHTEVHPWNLLRALKARLAPTDAARSFELEQAYARLVKGPSSRQNVEDWLDEYLKMYTLGKVANIAEVVDSKRAYRDFLHAIEKQSSTFAEIYELQMDEVTDYDAQILTIIEKFRHHMRMKDARKGKSTVSNSAFATDKGTSSFRGQEQVPRPCLCGKIEWFSDCPYLNESKRSADWEPDPAIQKKVNEALQNPVRKSQVEWSLTRSKAIEKRSFNGNKDKDSTNEGTFMVRLGTEEKRIGTLPADLESDGQTGAFSTKIPGEFILRSSWVMDHASGIHIANNTMKERFIKERDCTDGSTVISGTNALPIKAYGQIVVHVKTPAGKGHITLTNVIYVPDFMVNVVAGSILAGKGLHFDTQYLHLHRNGVTAIHVLQVGAHYVLEDNRKTSEGVASFATTTTVRSGSTLEWHQLLAHANDEAIQHLATAAEGVELTNNDPVPKTNKCETCALSKAHNIISRSPFKSETSEQPFFRITYDLIDMSTAMNKDEWVSHIACSTTNFHIVYTHPHKGQATGILIRCINTIETRYNGKVVFVHSDGERSLGKEWDNYIAAKGITFETSAVDTPAQNGHIERLGSVLMMKSRAMRLEAGLPIYLWPWITQTAGYLMNRTPSKKHSWKTPFEKATNQKPNLAHIVKYGAKAYPTDKYIPRREKAKAKAHIGFLVGYDSTNIFLIWIPSQRKVVRTRDVTFNEDSKYQPHEVDAAQLISEPFLRDDTLDIPQIDYARLTEIESDSDEEVFELAPTGSIVVDPLQEKETEKKAVKGYLPSASPSEAEEYTPSTSSVPTPPPTRLQSPSEQLQAHEDPEEQAPSASQRPHYHRSLLDDENVLPEGTTRSRKQKVRKDAYFNALTRVSGGGQQSFYGSFAAALVTEKRRHRDDLPAEPKYYYQMLKHPEAPGFLCAITKEIKDLQSKGTWREVSYDHAKQAGKIPIPTTWVFKYKFDYEGYLIKHKARMCARGDLQQTDQDVYAATLAIRIFRALMAITTAFELDTRQYDAVNAFANPDINEPTYCKPPDGWKGDSSVLLLLLKALYGLKQSPALWYKHLSTTLIKLGLEPVPGIECLFTCSYMILFFYVDDIAVLYYPRFKKQVDEFEKKLFEEYEMRNMGEIEWFLGIRVTRDRELQQTTLCQDSYIDKLISKFNVNTTGKAPGSPLAHHVVMTKNEEQATLQDIYAYQQRVGSINFSAITTRPDTAFAASKLAEFNSNPSTYHMSQADRVLEYLAHTKNYAIVYYGQAIHSDTIFLASSDASFADDLDTRQSSHGYCFKLYDGMIDWKASKQKTVTTSSTEAELLAMSMTANSKMWWDRFFDTIQMKIGDSTYIECDNRQTIRAFTKPGAQLTTKLRHVDIHRHWLRQEVQKGTINIQYTPTTSILADGLTKMLPPQRHKEFIKLIGLEAIHLEGMDENASEKQ